MIFVPTNYEGSPSQDQANVKNNHFSLQERADIENNRRTSLLESAVQKMAPVIEFLAKCKADGRDVGLILNPPTDLKGVNVKGTIRCAGIPDMNDSLTKDYSIEIEPSGVISLGSKPEGLRFRSIKKYPSSEALTEVIKEATLTEYMINEMPTPTFNL